MLTNLKEILVAAYKGGYAIPAFNVDNYEIMKAIVDACEEQKHPVVLMFTQSAIKYYGLNNLIAVANNLANSVSIPVVTHLDHELDVETCKAAINEGIQSIMYDGSHCSLETNINNTNLVYDYAKSTLKEISLEAELGQIAGVEDWKKSVNQCTQTQKMHCGFELPLILIV
ncbi:class II fructose-bisphosphate aldolase [Spiroplasma clarkii]|uniref:class II fructose-bisphosphate aldolase n=1 Tax=Spiroplasma clarkii TaxID=2139 RepID=UPI001649FF67|nr:class II fructose-bisphosphate aldolase [Spiroplasma clarkii]